MAIVIESHRVECSPDWTNCSGRRPRREPRESASGLWNKTFEDNHAGEPAVFAERLNPFVHRDPQSII